MLLVLIKRVFKACKEDQERSAKAKPGFSCWGVLFIFGLTFSCELLWYFIFWKEESWKAFPCALTQRKFGSFVAGNLDDKSRKCPRKIGMQISLKRLGDSVSEFIDCAICKLKHEFVLLRKQDILSWLVKNSESSAYQEWRGALAKRSCTGIVREELWRSFDLWV